MASTKKQRKLTSTEIEDMLSFITPNPYIPPKTAESVTSRAKAELRNQLKEITLFPRQIPKMKKKIKKMYYESIIQPGECVGIVTAQSIGEKQTQSNLNVFHKAGSSDKQPVVSKFTELLNATNKPKAPGYFIYFKEHPKTVQELRDIIGTSITEVTFKKIIKDYTFYPENERKTWYDIFEILYEEIPDDGYTACISLEVDMNILYENKLRMTDIARVISEDYSDLFVVFSPDNIGVIDILVKTTNIDMPEDTIAFIKEENLVEVYLEEVVFPILENIIIAGISGVNNIYFLNKKLPNGDLEWYVETENSRDKNVVPKKFKNTKEKPMDSTRRYLTVLGLDNVDMTRTISNNIWDIYHTLGIEAARQCMIDDFCAIMEGINTCHIAILVNKMTFNGTISSITRYTMRTEESGPLGKCSFEETLDNLSNAGVYGEEDGMKGVSSAVIAGNKIRAGTGMGELEMNLEKLMGLESIPEEL